MKEILDLIDVMRQRLDGFESFSRTQMDATASIYQALDTLKFVIESKNSDIEQMKQDIILIKEALKPGSRH